MRLKDTLFSVKQSINCGGTILDFSRPRIMGILNITPDSFYDGGRYKTASDIISAVEQMLSDGADIIDVGAYSSRPGAAHIPAAEEMNRLKYVFDLIHNRFTGVLYSVDTFRAEVAEYVVRQFGVHMINDISGGLLDEKMFGIAGSLQVPYVMMHMKGTPDTMQQDPEYVDVTREIITFFSDRIALAQEAGIKDIIIDPGFGFGKTIQHNFKLLHELKLFEMLGYPVLVGLSRKSMIYRSLHIDPSEALNGTTVLQVLALNNGAKILRVHDIREAVETVKLMELYHNSGK